MKKLLTFIKAQNEFIVLFIAWVLFYYEPVIVRWFDETAAPMDPGIISHLITAIVIGLVFQFMTWVCIKAVWPCIADYFSSSLIDHFNTLTAWQKIASAFFIYFSIFWLFVAILFALR